MLDNLRGSSEQDLVTRLQESRNAEQPEPEERPTGGTEEVEDTSTEYDDAPELDEGEPEYSDDDTEYDDTGEPEEPSKYRVKVSGEEAEVTLDELQSGYQREQDYRQKTMALAEQRKEVEAKEAAIATKLQELESFIEAQDKAIDWDELRDIDPSEYLKQKDLQEKRTKAAETARKEQEKAQQERMKSVIDQESKALFEKMGPKWEGEKRKADIEAAASYFSEIGVSEQEQQSIVDHRMYLMAMDAAKYRKLMQNKDKVSKQVKSAPKSVKPGQRSVPPQRELEQARNNLRTASKHEQDAAGVALLKAKRAKRGR